MSDVPLFVAHDAYLAAPGRNDVRERQSRLVSETGNALNQGVLSSNPKAMAAVIGAVKNDNNNESRKIWSKIWKRPPKR